MKTDAVKGANDLEIVLASVRLAAGIAFLLLTSPEPPAPANSIYATVNR